MMRFSHERYANQGGPVKHATFKQKFRYRFDSFMAKGGASIFMSLLVVFVAVFVLLGIARVIVFALFPGLEHAQWDESFLDSFRVKEKLIFWLRYSL